MLIIGADKTDTFRNAILNPHFPRTFLLVDDGTVIDCLDLPKRRQIKRLDFTKDSFNPFVRDYLRARQIVEILGHAWDGGSSTLTKETGLTFILEQLLTKPRPLAKLIPTPDKNSTTGHIWAHDKIKEILLSPVLYHVFNKQPSFDLEGTIIARLDRSLARFDRFLLGNLLMAEYKGQIVVPTFGSYACPFHIDMLDRMTVGLNSLDEPRITPEMRHGLLMMQPTKLFRFRRLEVYTHHACKSSYEDAVTLARYAGLRPDFLREDNAYNAFIEACIAGDPLCRPTGDWLSSPI